MRNRIVDYSHRALKAGLAELNYVMTQGERGEAQMKVIGYIGVFVYRCVPFGCGVIHFGLKHSITLNGEMNSGTTDAMAKDEKLPLLLGGHPIGPKLSPPTNLVNHNGLWTLSFYGASLSVLTIAGVWHGKYSQKLVNNLGVRTGESVEGMLKTRDSRTVGYLALQRKTRSFHYFILASKAGRKEF